MQAFLGLWCFHLTVVLLHSAEQSELHRLKETVGVLARQVMLQQLNMEERIRSDGDSGIKQCRINNEGTKTYHLPSVTSKRGIAAVHDHSNHERTVGIGEFIAVLNGVEFRTRHNDFLLRMPSTTYPDFLTTDEIPFPNVPPEVLNKPTVPQQVDEMKKWFQAWRDQDYSVRDYRKYFKPVLCYLEGTWISQSENSITEPFLSDRHWLDANSWRDLHDKIMFTSYGGRKNNLENFAWLPTTIMDVVNETDPVYAQWIYRILCHPLKRDIPTNRLRLKEDLTARMMYLRTLSQHSLSRRARFELNPRDTSRWKDQMVQNKELIDELMSEIPGLDNYGANLTDESFGNPVSELSLNGRKVNTGFYHRWWREFKPGAMGLSLRKRAFADKNIFMAMNTRPEVAGKTLDHCLPRPQQETCTRYQQKWSYAIPLEILYMTPLSTWNPYNVQHRGDADRSHDAGSVTAGGSRTGGITKQTAYNGTNSKYFYRTPATFFQGRVVDADKADTFRGSVGVLDNKGEVRAVTSSGMRVMFPNIPGVGILRQRYPIMPLHNEGNAVWKELDALKDMVLEHSKYLRQYRELPSGTVLSEKTEEEPLVLELSPGTRSPPGAHTHRIYLDADSVEVLKSGRPVTMITTETGGHSHMAKLRYKQWLRNPWVLFRCDGEVQCWDGHEYAFSIND